jgi:hypothetical protein
MRLPCALASSAAVRAGLPSGPTPMAPTVVFTPVDMAEAVAAESVAKASYACVVRTPIVPWWNTTSVTANPLLRSSLLE